MDGSDGGNWDDCVFGCVFGFEFLDVVVLLLLLVLLLVLVLVLVFDGTCACPLDASNALAVGAFNN